MVGDLPIENDDLCIENGDFIYIYIYIYWLVVWNMNFMTFHSVGNVIIPTDEVIFFRGFETSNAMLHSLLE